MTYRWTRLVEFRQRVSSIQCFMLVVALRRYGDALLVYLESEAPVCTRRKSAPTARAIVACCRCGRLSDTFVRGTRMFR